jgi:hypothetical protein
MPKIVSGQPEKVELLTEDLPTYPDSSTICVEDSRIIRRAKRLVAMPQNFMTLRLYDKEVILAYQLLQTTFLILRATKSFSF